MKYLLLLCFMLGLTHQIPDLCTEPALQAKYLSSDSPLLDADKTRICFSSLIEKGEY